MTAPIRVLVAEDNKLVRLGIVGLLRAHGFDVMGEADDGPAAVSLFRSLRPDVLLLDLRLPLLDGIDVIGQILRDDAGARILVLTHYDGEEDVFRAVKAGALGYVTKDDAPNLIVDALRQVAAGSRFLAKDMVERLAYRMTQPELTRRELQMLEGMARGLSNRDIARELGLSERTCAVHASTLFSKLDVQSRTQAVAVGLKRGLVRRPAQD